MARTPRTPPGTGNSWGRLSSLSDSAGSQARKPAPRRTTAKKPHPRGGSRSVHNRENRPNHQAAPSQRLDPFEGVTSKKRPASEVRSNLTKSSSPQRSQRSQRSQRKSGSQEGCNKTQRDTRIPFRVFRVFRGSLPWHPSCYKRIKLLLRTQIIEQEAAESAESMRRRLALRSLRPPVNVLSADYADVRRLSILGNATCFIWANRRHRWTNIGLDMGCGLSPRWAFQNSASLRLCVKYSQIQHPDLSTDQYQNSQTTQFTHAHSTCPETPQSIW
jgi:hypothetical protein